MAGDTVLILGAGFSKPAGGPLLRDLLTPACVGQSEADPVVLDALSRGLTERRDEFPSATVEDLFTDIWREARTGGDFVIEGEAWPAKILLAGITNHLASVCGRVHLRRSTSLWSAYTGFVSFLLANSRSLAVLTFNYDLLVEQICDDKGLRYEYGKRGGIEFDDASRRRSLKRSGPDLEILKLHGSANWGVCRGCRKAGSAQDLVTAFERPYVPTRRKRCPWCGDRLLHPGVIPPILGKAGESQHVEAIWRIARKSLRRAREVIVIGYSMPASDLEAVSLLGEIDAPNKRARIRVVCGPKGAPEGYSQVFARFVDTKQYFEDFAQSLRN